ncbi:GEVED domain-containing protein [Flavobacterium sp. RHBU_24]|uniref:GEVED domain-containing protein n=1 Tax=Flavobacterium sp. RHBU_24 TaxID=3391185 RepID=UPI0039848836
MAAQIYSVSAYTFAQSNTTYTPITGTEDTASPADWDNGNTSLPIGFDFVMNGITYTTVNLSYNGYITFGETLPSETNYSPISNSGFYDSAISAFGVNLKGSEGITYTTTGSAPGRTFIVQWNNAKRFTSLGQDVLNFQIQLHETTNVVDIVYGACSATLSNALVQVGLRGNLPSDYANRTSSASWAATTTGTYSGASISTSPVIMPVNGLQFSFTPPPACVAPAAPAAAVSNITPTAATVVITPADTPVTGHIVIRSSSPNIVIPPVTGNIYTAGTSLGGNPVLSVGSQVSVNDTGLMPDTGFYYFIYAYNSTTCGGGPLYSPATMLAATTCVPATVAAAASDITNTSATINWSSIMGSNATYDLEVYTDAEFTNLFGTAHNGLTTISFNLTGLTQGSTYYYRVRGMSSASCTESTFSTGSFTALSNLTPLSINPDDFNADVIANGPGLAGASTTQPVDDADYSYVARDYRNNINVLGNSYGLPVNRTITSMGGMQYLLADYSGNNALRLGGDITTGTLHLVYPVKLSSLNIAATSGAGSSVVNIQILFSDNTVQDVNNVPINDWFDNGNYIVSGIGRVNRNNDEQNADQEDSKIFQIPISIDAENQGKIVTGVQFTKVEGQIPNIFALSGRILTECPALDWISHTTASTSSATLNWSLATPGEGATSVTYTVGVYTDETYITPVAGFPVQNIQDTSYTLTNLVMDSPYYVRVQANNGTCTSAYLTDVVTIAYCTPAVFSLPNMGITNVVLGEINNTPSETDAYNKYTNYSNLIATSWPGGSVNFSISANPGDPGYQTKIWVDFNDDTDFDDEGELVTVIDNNTEYPFTAIDMFTIPSGAPLGNHRLRIGMAKNIFNENGPEPCSGATGDYEDYTLKIVSADCAVITVTPSIITSSSIKLEWMLINPGTGTTPTYIVEVYSDAAYTTPVAGSPFNVTAQTLTVTGLENGTYYYKVRASNGICISDDVTGSIALMPCIPTNDASDSLANTTSSITNVTTTNGFVNISNTSGQASGYTDYSYMAVKQAPGESFNYSVTVNGFTAVTIWVDWDNDLIFNSTNEQLGNFAAPAGTITGTITIPAGTPLGNYRMRIRSRNGSNTSPCDLIVWSEAEDYTVTVANAPNCFVPQNLTLTATGTAGTVSWAAPTTGTTPVGFEYAATTSQVPPAGSGTATTALSAPVTLIADATNYIYVRSNCGENNYSDWAVVIFYAGYCTPNSASTSNFINNFATTGATTNISNTASGYSENGYGNFTGEIVTQSNLSDVNFTASFGEGVATYGFSVWVDWNDDYDFADAGEQVFESTTFSGSASGTFTIPSFAALGSHRMRILADFNDESPDNPCIFSAGIGEAEDYTLVVNTTSGTVNNTFKNLSLYPNPVITDITITNSNVISGIRVVNLLGQTVIEKEFDAATVTVSVEQLPSATYIIQIYSENETATLKFVKQ